MEEVIKHLDQFVLFNNFNLGTIDLVVIPNRYSSS